MEEATVDLTPEQAEAQAEAAFAVGFGADASTETPKVDAEPVVEKAEPEKAPEPKVVSVTEEQLTDLLKKANEFDQHRADFKKKEDTIFGHIGGLKQALEKLQATTPAGHAITLTIEDFPELNEEFPEIVGRMVTGMNRALSKVKGTGSLDQTKIEELIKTHVSTAEEALKKQHKDFEDKAAAVRMTDLMPDWREIVGDVNKAPTPYRQWLATQSADQQTIINETSDPHVFIKSIKKFQDEDKKKKAADARNTVLNAAVPLKGAGAPSTPTKSEEDEFNEGFKTEYRSV